MMQTYDPMSGVRNLAVPGHIIALMLLISPLVGLTLAAAAPGPDGVLFRARMFSLMTDSGLWVLLGAFLGTLLSALFRQRGARWAYAAVAGVLGLGLALAVPMFALDVMQLRGTVNPQVLRLYDANVVRNGLSLMAFSAVLLWLSIASIRSLLRERQTDRARSATAGPGLVGSSRQSQGGGATAVRMASATRS